MRRTTLQLRPFRVRVQLKTTQWCTVHHTSLRPGTHFMKDSPHLATRRRLGRVAISTRSRGVRMYVHDITARLTAAVASRRRMTSMSQATLHRKFSEVRTCGFRDACEQTDRQAHGQTHSSQYQGGTIIMSAVQYRPRLLFQLPTAYI